MARYVTQASKETIKSLCEATEHLDRAACVLHNRITHMRPTSLLTAYQLERLIKRTARVMADLLVITDQLERARKAAK